jgi:hypothetical protein
MTARHGYSRSVISPAAFVSTRYSGPCSNGLGAAAHALGMAVRNVESLCVDLVEAGMIARAVPRSWQAGAPWEPPGEETGLPLLLPMRGIHVLATVRDAPVQPLPRARLLLPGGALRCGLLPQAATRVGWEKTRLRHRPWMSNRDRAGGPVTQFTDPSLSRNSPPGGFRRR